ncbi:transporter substrate-binding domain-containing protein [Aeromonas caviae]|uniref:transporter substrate-binding domain-containing protein n=1 Tax=Aeromonas caviae TaxID=648 RepID=UPI002B49BDFE|nr:transporter substrate-binding domain-containing protein [Aeromonas caviae]
MQAGGSGQALEWGGLSIGASRIDLSREQWKWLGKREKIRIAVNSGIPPLSFYDVTGTMHGVVADLLQVMRAKLGVELEVVPAKTPEQMTQLLDSGQVDAGVLSPSAERRNRYLFSRAFVLDPLSYVVGLRHREVPPASLLKTGTVAMVRGFISTQAIEAEYGKLTSRQFDTIEDAMRCVAMEVCDVTILPLRVAKYYVNSKFPDSLLITGELFDSIPIGAAFAVTPAHPVLRDILDNVIAIIPPDELEGLSNRWRVNVKQESVSWQELIQEFGVFIALILLLTLWVGLWGLSLRKQIRERRLVEGGAEHPAQVHRRSGGRDTSPHLCAGSERDPGAVQQQLCQLPWRAQGRSARHGPGRRTHALAFSCSPARGSDAFL